MKRKILSSAILAVAGGLWVSAARADNVSINATFEATGHQNNYESVTINDPTYLPVNSYGVGVYNFTTNSVTTTVGGSPTSPITASQLQSAGISSGTTFSAVCIDFTHEISTNQTADWSIVNLTQVQASPSGNAGDGNGVGITQVQSVAIAHLWDTAHALYGSNLSTNANENVAAELQLAIWDVLYDKTVGANLNPASATLFSNNGNIGNAMTDASAALAYATLHPQELIDVYAMVDAPPAGYVQDFAIVGPVQTNIVGTPLPRTVLAGFPLLLGFAGVEFLRKRSSDKAQLA